MQFTRRRVPVVKYWSSLPGAVMTKAICGDRAGLWVTFFGETLLYSYPERFKWRLPTERS